MPSFWQQSTNNIGTNLNHTPSHHYWSQNSQDTREEIHKDLFHTSLSLQNHPQPPPTDPWPSSEFCWVIITRSVVYRVLKKRKKKNWEILHAATNSLPAAATTPAQPSHPPPHPRDQYKLPTPICPPPLLREKDSSALLNFVKQI